MTPEENAEFKKVFSGMADVLSARAAAPAPHTYTPTMNTAEAEAEARRRLDASLRGERLPPPVGAVRDAEQKIVVDMAAKMKAINDFDADMNAQGYRFVE
jgi:ribosomal protein L1